MPTVVRPDSQPPCQRPPADPRALRHGRPAAPPGTPVRGRGEQAAQPARLRGPQGQRASGSSFSLSLCFAVFCL